MVGVAQLVEPRIVIPVVVGSIPIVHPSLRASQKCGEYRESLTCCESGGIGRRAGFRFQCRKT